MNARMAASLLLLGSLAVPWTVTWGTNTVWATSSSFYIFEFPFIAYYVIVYDLQGTNSGWKLYQSAPKYFGTTLVLLGGIIALLGTMKKDQNSLVEWGGTSSLIGLIFFSGSRFTEVVIPCSLVQRYMSIPIGMFIPATFWILILHHPQKGEHRFKRSPFSETKLFCGECGQEISPEFSFCPFCGTGVHGILCHSCGRRISADYKYCPFCGSETKIEKHSSKPLVL